MKKQAITGKYVVTCFSPAVTSPVKSGDQVEVVGRVAGRNMKADAIKNLKANATCRCGAPPLGSPSPKTKIALPKTQKLTGKVTNIVNLKSGGVQFDLLT